MALNLFKTLAEYVKASQIEWSAATAPEDEFDLQRERLYETGIQAMQAGRFEEAIPSLKKATESSKYRKDAYYYLAECYQRVNMLPLARKTYERLMRLDYHFKDVQERIRALDAPSAASFPMQRAPSATVAMPAHDRYDMIATLHDGQRARIYKVRDTLLERTLALKQIAPAYRESGASYFHQLKERTAVTHLTILRIYDIDEAQGQITMEYVEGRDLRSTLRMKGALAPNIAVHIAIQLVNGLHQAHLKQIVHHALTPEHLLLTRQCLLKIIAFRALDSFVSTQKTDEPYKYLYMPPECFTERSVTIASNVYSFGVILYEMLTGSPPFHLHQLKAWWRHAVPLTYPQNCLPPAIQTILQRCLHIDPTQRYPTIHAVGEALIAWFKAFHRDNAHDDEVAAYKDYLLMAWADGSISDEEAAFLTHKRQELRITDAEAAAAETDAKRELQELLRQASKDATTL